MKCVRIVLALALISLCYVCLGWAHPAFAQEPADCARDVIVQSGDTLSILAGRHVGDSAAYMRIVNATNARARVDPSYAEIRNANTINVGWKLCIPAATTDAAESAPRQQGGTAASAAGASQPTLLDIVNLDLVEELDLDQVRALSIDSMRQRSYAGSEITIHQTLEPGANYNRYLASYRSDGLQIFALLTVPTAPQPSTGWPVIVFNHGYIPPALYSPTERYEAYVDALARNGYIVFRPDYRGHGDSDGDAHGAYGSPAYTIDVLNAVASIKRYPAADAQRIGMWGHSMGGYIALRSMVITGDVRAGVIWAGVVASYADMFALLDITNVPISERAREWRTQLIAEFGTPAENPAFWDSISAHSYLTELSGPIQLHHGTGDTAVPFLFSLLLQQQLRSAGQTSEYFAYSGDDHNISENFPTAMQRSLDFFERYVKNPSDEARVR